MFILHFNNYFVAHCFQFLSKIEKFCVSIKGHNYFALFSSMYSFFFWRKHKRGISRLLFAVNEILNLSIIIDLPIVNTRLFFQELFHDFNFFLVDSSILKMVI